MEKKRILPVQLPYEATPATSNNGSQARKGIRVTHAFSDRAKDNVSVVIVAANVVVGVVVVFVTRSDVTDEGGVRFHTLVFEACKGPCIRCSCHRCCLWCCYLLVGDEQKRVTGK